MYGRREFLVRSLTAAAGATLTSAPATATLSSSARQAESAMPRRDAAVPRNTEPPLVHYHMPYAGVSLQPGSMLTRAYDEAALLAALQGIVNRDAPRLYILGVSGGGIADLDSFWWQRMGDLGWSVARQQPYEAQSLSELLQLFKHRARGLVVWDPSVPATANVAATLAGVLDLLPVAYRPGSGAETLYSQIVSEGWRATVSLVHADGSSVFTGKGTIPGTDLPSTGSAKNDAYLWAKVNYLDRGLCDSEHMAYYIDSYWLLVPGAANTGFWNNDLVNHDYFVSQRAFFFDLDPWNDEAPVDDPHQPPGTDAATMHALLDSAYHLTNGQKMIDVGGFPPWGFKYTNYGEAGGQHSPVATEWKYAWTLSAYNAFMEADALGYDAIANASFTQHLPLRQRYPQPGPPDASELRRRGLLRPDGTVPPGLYFAFYVGDFDSPAWLYQNIPSLWNDPARGRVPLSWAFDPNLALRAAPAMAWTRQTRTAHDTFVAGDSGAGYLNPGALEAPRLSGLPSGIDVWARHCRRFYRQWDIQVTGFIIEGSAPTMKAAGLKAYATFSPGGIVGQQLPFAALVDGMPVMAMTSEGIGGTPKQAATSVLGLFLPLDTPQFVVARAVLQTPSWYEAVAQSLRASAPPSPPYPGPVQVLDLPTLLALLGAYAKSQAQPGALASG